MMTMLVVFICKIILAGIKILFKMRLGIPVLYIAACNTMLAEWQRQNYQLAMAIFIALVGIVGVSWIVTTVRFFRGEAA